MISAGVFLLVITISTLSIFLLMPMAPRLGLIDSPDQHRKLHVGNIPLIGGISIYTGLVIGISTSMPLSDGAVTYLLCSSLIVGLGVVDDARDISPKLRLIVQAIVAGLMCVGSGLYIENLGSLFGLGDINLGALGYAFTVVAVIAAINAFNMIDGIDGLLGISSLITFMGMGVLFFLNNDWLNVYLTLIISVALIPYLVLNLGLLPGQREKKIFMGDTGSMLIGFTVVWLLIQGTQTVPEGQESPSFTAATALWLIAFPLMDMARIMFDRYKRGHSIFKPDRYHLHHIVLKAKSGDKYAALLQICTLSAFFAVVGVAMDATQTLDVFIFSVFLIIFGIYSARVSQLKKKHSEGTR